MPPLETKREGAGSGQERIVSEIRPAEAKEKVGQLKWNLDDIGDLKGDNLIQIVDAKGQTVKGAMVSFERLTIPGLIEDVNIKAETLDFLSEKEAATNGDIENPEVQETIREYLDEDVLKGVMVEIFRQYFRDTGGDILRAKNTAMLEPKIGNVVTLSSEHTYIIARSGAEKMKNYLEQGVPRRLGDGREIFSSLAVNNKLEGAGLGFSAAITCGQEKIEFDFIFGDEENKDAPAEVAKEDAEAAKPENEELPLAA